MVQQYQSPVRVYKHPFALVMLAYEKRFPTCPQIPVFVGCDVTKDEESQGGAIRTTERRCKLNVEAPYILKKIIGVDYVYFIQKNVLDRRNSILEIEAWNESFSSRVTVIEKCRYFIHPENSEWTCFEQTASLDIKNFFGFENSMEKLAMKQYAQNIAKGKEIIEYFINELKEQGVTYVAPWVDPEKNPPKDEKTIETEESNDQNDVETETKLPVNKEIKLSSDYIERYLGKLDLMQESKLLQLRQSIQELRGASVPNDATLLRFLRAREFMVDKAKEMLTQSLHWRKKYQIDKLLDEYEAPRVVKDYFPGGWHHCDKDGRPLYILRLGQMDVKGLLKSIGEDELLLLALHICEEGLSLMEEATTVLGHPVSQWCLLIDLEGLNMHENTRNKFIFYCGTDYQEQNEGGLTDYIDAEYIPDFLGGPSETYVMEGGVVPKSLYRLDLEAASNDHEHSLYHSISLAHGQVHHVAINTNDPGAVLTWDFDVMRHNVIFTVLHEKQDATNINESLEITAADSDALKEWKDVLPSAHYRGSMMSLQSAVSGRSVASSSLSR
ncbi:Similar to retm: Protein real-time (Aedes aegypti) [Cotesia congregata]|uniref:Similar to retm: Protein real-time (Aedes aegypti) n=1 Tax=Cotesia congregata TaxID=51543 RepID=A0A8J2HB16_COTCN|nr:Similar to retm: Protein real-time (Aedes aegypti) [Cotesia congregata]